MFSRVFQNRVIRSMVAIEFFASGAYGLFAPVFAIFAADVIVGGSAKVVGFSMAIFWLVKAAIQMPTARFLDNVRGEKDDYKAYILGQILLILGMLLYLKASTPSHVYLLQALLGLSYGLNTPAFYGLFSRHLDRYFESSEWSIYSVFSYSISVAIAGAAGGLIVTYLGFKTLFIAAAVGFTISTVISLIFLRPSVAGRSERPPVKIPGMISRDPER